jgi:hypothetical protein
MLFSSKNDLLPSHASKGVISSHGVIKNYISIEHTYLDELYSMIS